MAVVDRFRISFHLADLRSSVSWFVVQVVTTLSTSSLGRCQILVGCWTSPGVPQRRTLRCFSGSGAIACLSIDPLFPCCRGSLLLPLLTICSVWSIVRDVYKRQVRKPLLSLRIINCFIKLLNCFNTKRRGVWFCIHVCVTRLVRLLLPSNYIILPPERALPYSRNESFA